MLSWHYDELVHTSEWTGNRAWAGPGPTVLRSICDRLCDDTDRLLDPNASYPPGWARELSLWNDSAEKTYANTRALLNRRVVTAVWHSWLTGIYRESAVTQDIWYTGGPLEDGLPRLELRDREPAGDT